MDATDNRFYREKQEVVITDYERLLQACRMFVHNHGILHGMKGKAWDGAFVMRELQEALQARDERELAAREWRDIETAPKDGTRIIAWCVHENAKYAKDPIAEGWEAAVIAYWTDFNHGGWVWHGHAGTFTKWQPLPPAPKGR